MEQKRTWEEEDVIEGFIVPELPDGFNRGEKADGTMRWERKRLCPISDKNDAHGTYIVINGDETHAERVEKLLLMESEYTRSALIVRKQFVMEYVVDFNATQAALRCGMAKTKQVAGVRGSKVMREAYVQLLLAMYLEQIQETSLVTRNMVLAGLLKEANYHADDASHAARVAAWGKLAKLIGMDIDRSMSVSLSAQPPQPITEEAQQTFLENFLGKY